MAPEQLDGKAVTVKSDLYSLGLLLYELFTGKRAFKAATPAEMERLQRESTPTSPSSHVTGLDDAVERVILRCMEHDPAERPASALAVAAALPGGDPLAAALAAGETPSPEIVADAGRKGGLHPAIGATCLALILIGLVGRVVYDPRSTVAGHVPLGKPPEALAVEAREIIRLAGHTEEPADSVHGFVYDTDYIKHLRSQEPFPDRWDEVATIRPAPIRFWYRQSPRYLVAQDLSDTRGEKFVTPDAPQWDVPGMIGVWLDPAGRLLRFQSVPPRFDDSPATVGTPDWSTLFEAAGLDIATFREDPPTLNPPFAHDGRSAWAGAYPDQPEVPIRIEAASYRDRPLYFEVIPPWHDRKASRESEPSQSVGSIYFFIPVFVIMFGGILMARRNLRLGRGDRRGAFRLASFFFALYALLWLLRADHVPAIAEVGLFFQFLETAFFGSGMVWVVYVALEPHVRRIWPAVLISWSRLIAGRIRDPLIGRDILFGALAGLADRMWHIFYRQLLAWLSQPTPPLSADSLEWLAGIRHTLGGLAQVLTLVLYIPMGWLFILLLLRVILRKQWLTVVVFLLTCSTLSLLSNPGPVIWIQSIFTVVTFSLFLFVLQRWGILAMVFYFLFIFIGTAPLTFDLSSWYAGRSLFVLLGLAGLAAYGFYISLAGRPLFREP
jgi:serine/threonine-protein kinase